jgi:mono/diheme cytochrome c family protein
VRPLLAVVALTCALVAAAVWLRPRLPAAERGRRIAERAGCFACHGAEGIRGTANPGRKDASVPAWDGDLMMFAEDDGEVREWIRDGVPAERGRSRTWEAERDSGALRMPAFGRRLTRAQIEDLVVFVLAVGGAPVPGEVVTRRGSERAGELGCAGCHGPGGRFARPNPGSLKGYVPPWDGGDFAELVRGRLEFDQWVGEGMSHRFARDPLARFFLERATIRMPAYRRFLRPGDLDTLWAYIRWLRTSPAVVGGRTP